MTPTFARLLLWFLAGVAIGGCAERQHRIFIYPELSGAPTWDSGVYLSPDDLLEQHLERGRERRQRLREQI